MNSIRIDLGSDKFNLILEKEEKVASELEICFDRNLAEKLLEGIDKILKINKLNKTDLDYLELLRKPDEDRTSDRIAMSIVEAFKALK